MLTKFIVNIFKYINSSRAMIKIPSAAVFNITYRCQLKCKICNIEKATQDRKELNTSQIIAMLTDLSKSGITTIDFVGGEVLLKEDIKDILKAARALFKTVKLVTNGVNGLDYADFLLSLPLDHITVSLDGSKSATHDYIRGDGAFLAVTNFLSYLKSKKNRNTRPFVTVNSVIVKDNVAELVDILNLSDYLHCDNITYEVFLCDNAQLKLNSQASSFWIKDRDLCVLGEQIKQILSVKNNRSTNIYVASTHDYLSNIVNYYSGNLRPNIFTCRNGLDFVTIRSDGEALICNLLLGNIIESGFLPIWNSNVTKDVLNTVAHCSKPCMMNCMVGGVEYYGKQK